MNKQERRTPAEERRVLVALWMGCDFGRDALGGIRAAARGLAWRIRFTNTEAAFRAAVRWMLRERRIEGAITCFPLPDAMAALRRAGVPAVLIDRGDAPPPQVFGPRVARVTLDVPAVARAAVDHFLERAAFRSAGFVESLGDAGWSRLRGDACMAEFARRGLRGARFRHRRAAEPDFDRLAAWIRALEKPAAVVAANDATAADVLDLCEAEGVAVPRDVAVLGMDDDPAFCLRCEPNLSSVHFDGVAAGRLAADALASMMVGGPAPPEGALRYSATAIVRRARPPAPSPPPARSSRRPWTSSRPTPCAASRFPTSCATSASRAPSPRSASASCAASRSSTRSRRAASRRRNASSPIPTAASTTSPAPAAIPAPARSAAPSSPPPARPPAPSEPPPFGSRSVPLIVAESHFLATGGRAMMGDVRQGCVRTRFRTQPPNERETK